MATYASLTTEEKDILNTMVTNLRAWAGSLARSMQDGQVLDDDWAAQVSAIVGSLDAAEIVPNTSGLAGAASLTKEEITALMNTSLSNLLSTYNTASARQLYVKLAGPGNVISG